MGCALQVYTYHGQDRNSSVPFLEQHDIVITTYSILTGERSMRNGLLKVMHHTVSHGKIHWRSLGVCNSGSWVYTWKGCQSERQFTI